MAFIRRIQRGERIYHAKVENIREGGKVRQKFIRYVKKNQKMRSEDLTKY